MLRFMTAGESHGKGLIVIIDGLPRGIRVDESFIAAELAKRKSGFGRGPRMERKIEYFELLSGIKDGWTTGSPVSIFIANEKLCIEEEAANRKARGFVAVSRPGHADLAGAMKFLTDDLFIVSERASARETAARVAAGAIFKSFLLSFKISIFSHTISVGKVSYKEMDLPIEMLRRIPNHSPLRCVDKVLEKKMMREIDRAAREGDSVGGSFQIVAAAVPPGLGSFTQWDRRSDAMISQALMSIPGVKAVEIGNGIKGASSFGSNFHDEIFYDGRRRKFYRGGNNAGGIEGGITNGEEIRVKAFLKPVPTLRKPLQSISLKTKKREKASIVRSDVCPIVAASVIGESMLAFVLASLLLEKFGGDTIAETLANYNSYMRSLKKL
ncbi:MAG: chorismate synthase [Acidobacteriota bacterium]